MERVTVSVNEQEEEIIEKNVGEGGEYESRSEFVRECIKEYEKRNERVEELENEVDRLRNEKQAIIQEREEKKELVKYVERERTVSEQWRRASLKQRVKWKIFGMPEDI